MKTFCLKEYLGSVIRRYIKIILPNFSAQTNIRQNIITPAKETPPPTPPRTRGGGYILYAQITIDRHCVHGVFPIAGMEERNDRCVHRSPLLAYGPWCWGWGSLLLGVTIL